MQKSGGAWTFDGGGGVIVNPAAGMNNANFGGVLTQYTLSSRWTLGAEVSRQNALAVDQPGYTLLNAGGYLNVSQNFSVLFSAGASGAGAPHTVAYLGLYWTWASPGFKGHLNSAPSCARILNETSHEISVDNRRLEWHLLKLLGISITPYFFASDGPWLGE